MQRRWITTGAAALGGVALLLTAASPANADPDRRADIARETLAAGDGWAAAGTGTTGGSAATPEHVFTVGDRAGLVAAVAGDEPKIVVVSGVIDANTDDTGAPLTCADYARDGYTLDAYLAAYDPAVWGWDAGALRTRRGRTRRVAGGAAGAHRHPGGREHHAHRPSRRRDHGCRPADRERLERHRPRPHPHERA